MNLFKNFLLLLLIVSAASCVQNKKLIYLQNFEDDPTIADGELITYEMPEYKLQYNDIVDVKVQTGDQQVNMEFAGSTQVTSPMMAGQLAQGGGDVYYMTGYTVNKDGEIRLPILGAIKVQDMTLEETRIAIEESLRKYASNEIYVRVKLGGIRYSALGEFRRPGKFVVLQDRMTILEAVAHAGDLTTVAQRDEVVLIRQYPDGTRIHRLNLRDRNLIKSPFYFIQPNDQIYVEPMRVRELGAGENAVQTLSVVVTSLTAAALVINIIMR